MNDSKKEDETSGRKILIISVHRDQDQSSSIGPWAETFFKGRHPDCIVHFGRSKLEIRGQISSPSFNSLDKVKFEETSEEVGGYYLHYTLIEGVVTREY